MELGPTGAQVRRFAGDPFAAAEAFLATHGCTLAQGYLYGRPMPGPGMQALLHKRRTGELAAAS